MATKKKARKAKKTAKPKKAAKKAKTIKKKAAARKAAPTAKKIAAPKKKAGSKATTAKPAARRMRGKADSADLAPYERRGLGSRAAGQSGDTHGLSGAPGYDSESVEELLEEGQSFEAEAIAGVENAPDPDEAEVTTHEVPEDDVPEEYLDKDV
jgi:hypothetical protein